MLDAPKRSATAVADTRFLILTTNRAHPGVKRSFEAFDSEDDRAPFHWWCDSAGNVSRVREPADFILPDGVAHSPVAYETCRLGEVLCVSGLLWNSRTSLHGSNLLPKTLENLREFTSVWCQRHRVFPQRALVGAWELGAEAYAAEDLVGVLRSIRNEPELYTAPNRFYAFCPPLQSVKDQRHALQALGYSVNSEDVNDRWQAKDQRALLDFQRTHNLRETGWFDPATKVAVFERLAAANLVASPPAPSVPSAR